MLASGLENHVEAVDHKAGNMRTVDILIRTKHNSIISQSARIRIRLFAGQINCKDLEQVRDFGGAQYAAERLAPDVLQLTAKRENAKVVTIGQPGHGKALCG